MHQWLKVLWLLITVFSTQGWLTEKITSDSLKITADNKYEYRVELINVFLINSHARLYVKVLHLGKK